MLSRKSFLKQSALFGAGMLLAANELPTNKIFKLSFSTLGCPDWSSDKFMSFAQQHGSTGLEVRGILRQMELPHCPEFNTAAARKDTLRQMKKNGLQFVALGSSANLHIAEMNERQKNLDEAKRFIDLAAEI